ncbi:glycosyltransferase family 2 protein [Flexivirga caeni]|uniref:Glycosyltransferase family 2 protein n=1 Tax=Flexivirga caeni TaxID=2294115 RepID=A0A3M9M9Q4_9MICO|nr:glycosyltransferase family 2 protein [Flexivirga caeni]RNI21593.1 glycosyltransferase family 2 protein [Flexivirga caeni]
MTSVAQPPDLSVIIPMCNAAATVGAVLTSFLDVPGYRTEVIVVDDGSTDDSVPVVEALGREIDLVRLAGNHGAGHARNVGFGRATGRYTIFFDADDELHPTALAHAIDGLDGADADVAMMPYTYRRGWTTDYTGMNSFDEVVWERYLAGAGRRLVRLSEVPRLLGFSNYPWNKVLRTARFRRTGLRFSETQVHNDILGHWMTLLDGRTILLLDEAVCTHIVGDGGGNLSHRMGRERLALFDALDETYDVLQARAELRNRYSHHYWDFVLRSSGWALDRLAPEVADEGRQRLQQHLLRINLADYLRIRERRDPSLADRIVRRSLA